MKNKKWIIGFYNEILDNKECLTDCYQIYNSWNKMVSVLRQGDIVKINSTLSLFGIPIEDILKVKEKFSIIFDFGEARTDTAIGNLLFNTQLACNEYFMDNKETMIKLLHSYKN